MTADQLAAPKAAEDPREKYARHTRNAVVFIAVVVGISVLFAVIWGLIVGVDLIGLSHSLNGTVNGTGQACSNNPGSLLPSC